MRLERCQDCAHAREFHAGKRGTGSCRRVGCECEAFVEPNLRRVTAPASLRYRRIPGVKEEDH